MPLPNETFDTGKPASGGDLAPVLRQPSPGVAEGEDRATLPILRRTLQLKKTEL